MNPLNLLFWVFSAVFLGNFSTAAQVGDGNFAGNAVLHIISGAGGELCQRVSTGFDGVTSCINEADDDGVFDINAGGCVTVTFNTSSTGTTPPIAPNGDVEDICAAKVFYEDNRLNPLMTLFSGNSCPADDAEFSICGSVDGTSATAPRAGIFWVSLHSRSTTLGAVNFDVNNQGAGVAPAGGSFSYARGYLRGDMNVEGVFKQNYRSNNRYAYPEDFNLDFNSTPKFASFGDENVLFDINLASTGANVFHGRETMIKDWYGVGDTRLDVNVDSNFPKGHNDYNVYVKISGLTRINAGSEMAWTRFQNRGHGPDINRIDDNWVRANRDFNADSNIFISSDGVARDGNWFHENGPNIMNLGQAVKGRFYVLNANSEKITTVRSTASDGPLLLASQFVLNDSVSASTVPSSCTRVLGCEFFLSTGPGPDGNYSVSYIVDHADKNTPSLSGSPKHLGVKPSYFGGARDSNTASDVVTHTVTRVLRFGKTSACADANTNYKQQTYNRGDTVDFNFFLCHANLAALDANRIDLNIHDANGSREESITGERSAANGFADFSYVIGPFDLAGNSHKKRFRMNDGNFNFISRNNDGADFNSQDQWQVASQGLYIRRSSDLVSVGAGTDFVAFAEFIDDDTNHVVQNADCNISSTLLLMDRNKMLVNNPLERYNTTFNTNVRGNFSYVTQCRAVPSSTDFNTVTDFFVIQNPVVDINSAPDVIPIYEQYFFSFLADSNDFNASQTVLTRPTVAQNCTSVVIRIDDENKEVGGLILKDRDINFSVGNRGLVSGWFRVGELATYKALSGEIQSNRFNVGSRYVLKVYCSSHTYLNRFLVRQAKDVRKPVYDLYIYFGNHLSAVILGVLVLILFFSMVRFFP